MKKKALEAISQLHELIQICRESHREFARLARQASDAHVHALFEVLAADRARYIRELQDRAHALGEADASFAPDGAGTDFAGEAAERDLLATCERAEDTALAAYQRAVLEGGFDAATQRLVENQYAEIHAAHDRLRVMHENHPLMRH